MAPSFGKSLELRRPPVPPMGAAARLLDVVVAAAVLIFVTPIMILVAAAIFVEDGGPILFSQVRLGRRGRHFRMYKFRKFHKGRPAGPSLTAKDDPRLTCVGRFLARTKLDELPQLWNVLKADMSIVGPRPESLDFRDCFEGCYGAVLEYRPGIFGPSQVLFRNEGSLYRGRADPEQFYRNVLFPLKARIDLAYFTHRTLFRDFVWAVRGALAVFGWSSLVHEGTVLIEEAEDRVRKGYADGPGLLVEIGILTRRRGVAEVAREGPSRSVRLTGARTLD